MDFTCGPRQSLARQTSVQYDEIYQCRRVTAGASDTEKQSPTLDKCAATRSRIERAVQTGRSVSSRSPARLCDDVGMVICSEA